MAYRVIGGGTGAQMGQPVIEGIRPTVVIGLGGTGGDVLLKLRKMIFERYGSPSEFPVLQFLYIDTDTSNQHIDSALLEEFKFDNPERIDAIVPDTVKYTRHLSQYPLLKEWWYPTMQDHTSITVGAGQIRGYSRLGFYVNFQDIKTAVQTAMTAASASATTMLERWHVTVDTAQGANVYIVGSIAGGTGSGMFLDVAFLCKSLVPHQIVGYLVMPGAFMSNVDRLSANGFSALKELEHYGQAEFSYQWAQGYPPKTRPLAPPPFAYCYLVDSKNADGNSVEFKTRHTLFQMVANSIFHDFGSSNFAAQKRSARVNLDMYLNDYYVAEILDPRDPAEKLLSEVFSMRQSAFGVATIQYPADRIKRALGAKLACDIVRRLAQGQPPKGEFGKWVRETFFKGGYEQTRFDFFIGNVTLANGQVIQRHDILDALYSTSQPGLKIQSVVDDRINQLQADIANGVYRMQQVPLSQFLRAQEQDILLNLRDQPEHNSGKWGDWAKWLRINRGQFLEEQVLGSRDPVGHHQPSHLERAIGVFVNKPDMGIAFAREVLREIRNTVTQDAYPYLSRFRHEAEGLKAEVQRLQARAKDVWSEVQRRETEAGIRQWLFGDADREQLIKDYLTAFRGYLQAAVRLRARLEAIAICEKALAIIGEEGVIEEKTGERTGDSGLLRALLQLENSLTDLAAGFDGIAKEYSKKGDDLNTLLLYDSDDLELRYYPKYLDKSLEVRAQRISEHAQNLLNSLPSVHDGGSGVTVMELPELVAIQGTKSAIKLILGYCDQVFHSLQDDFEVLEMFYDKYRDPVARVQQLNLLFSKAQIWLEGSHQSGFTFPNAQRIMMVGRYFNAMNPKNYNQFQSELSTQVRKPHHPLIVYYDTPAKNEIVFYCEAAGYPLCYSQAVHDMRPKYEKLAFDDLANLHADRNEYRFKEILEMTEKNREELETATRTFLFGIMLDVIKVNEDSDGEVVFKLQQKVGLNTTERSIGTEHRALHVLLRHSVMRSQVDTLIREREDELKAKADGWAKYYALVSYFERDVYPPTTSEHVSKEHRFRTTTENLVLRRKLKDIEASAGDLDALELEGQVVLGNLTAHTITLPNGFKAMKHAWSRPAAVRL
jgi:hypothetical protein